MLLEQLRTARARYLASFKLATRSGDPTKYPWRLPFLRSLDVELTHAVTIFVGENGSGKSTLLEALAESFGVLASGGGRNESAAAFAPRSACALADALKRRVVKPPSDVFFLRAEFIAHFASLLEAREADPDFWGDPYARYGGKTLFERSHGEAFLAVARGALKSGLYFLDESESALSPQRQLALLALIAERVQQGAQFLMATHSPMLMTIPGAVIYQVGERLRRVGLEETEHYQIVREILARPERYWHHLLERSS